MPPFKFKIVFSLAYLEMRYNGVQNIQTNCGLFLFRTLARSFVAGSNFESVGELLRVVVLTAIMVMNPKAA